MSLQHSHLSLGEEGAAPHDWGEAEGDRNEKTGEGGGRDEKTGEEGGRDEKKKEGGALVSGWVEEGPPSDLGELVDPRDDLGEKGQCDWVQTYLL